MNLSNRHLFAACCLLLAGCSPWPVEMTSQVSGTVIDAANRNPVADAKIYFAAFPGHAVLSSSQGQFFIAPIRQWQIAVVGTDVRSSYSLVVEAKGYLTTQRNWEVGDDRAQTIELQVKKE